MTLQRDYIGILPIAAAVLLAWRNLTPNRRDDAAFAIGACFALSASIKPHLALGLPVVIIYMIIETTQSSSDTLMTRLRSGLAPVFWAGLGFSGVLVLPLLWLWRIGGLPYFWDMFTNYLPLHLQLSGSHEMLVGGERWLYLFEGYKRFGAWPSLLIPIVMGLYLLWPNLNKDGGQANFVRLLWVLLGVYSLYPVLGGKFWFYHWMPFVYFGAVCAPLMLAPLALAQTSVKQQALALAIFIFFLVIVIRPSYQTNQQLLNGPLPPPKGGRGDEVAHYLQAHLQPGDTVQPLDWTNGAVHGMLISRAVVATPYIYDYHFYHHVSSPYIQHLRQDFINRLKEKNPRFIIEMQDVQKPRGPDTTRDFPALRMFIQANYAEVYQGNGVKIFESKILQRAP